MPYPSEHSARVRDPDDFEHDSFRRKELPKSKGGKGGVVMIIGKLKGEDTMTVQAYRFPKDLYTVAEAKQWLKDNDIEYISFEPAEEEKSGEEQEIEQRVVRFAELRLAGEPTAPVIDGYAAVFNSPSEDLYFIEMIEPGFFENCMEDDTRALFNHDTNIVLGRTKSQTLAVKEDEKGLYIHITPPATALINDMVLEPIRRGDVDQMSFSFAVAKGGDEWVTKDEKVTRTLKRGGCKRLYDVSPVTFPAYPKTSVSVRSKFQELQSQIPPLPGGEEAAEQMVQVRLKMLRRRLELAMAK
jgi:hypothetical protein